MTKCVEEITYLLTPPAHPLPAQTNFQPMANPVNFMAQGDASLGLEDVYLQQRQKGQQPSGSIFSHPSTMPNHQPPPIPSMNDIPTIHQTAPNSQQATLMTREPSSQQSLPQNFGPSTDIVNHQALDFNGSNMEEPVEKITHRYDVFGRPIPAREEEIQGTRHIITEYPEEWDTMRSEDIPLEPPQEAPTSRRPDIDAFPSANLIPSKSPPRSHAHPHRRKSSGSNTMIRRRSDGHDTRETTGQGSQPEPRMFKVRWSLRGHLDVVRSIIFTGGGSPSEPEICTAGDDGMIKRWIIPASYIGLHGSSELDVQSAFTHRGHDGVVMSLAACPASANFSIGGRVSGDGWIFSGGKDGTVRVWERGRVDPKATLTGHEAEVWTVCVLPTTCASVFGQESSNYGGPDRILLASGSADGTIKIWAVSAPPQILSPSTNARRGIGGSRRHSVTSGSNFPSSPQPSMATATPFDYTLIHTIQRSQAPSPTCIYPLSITGTNFVVSYSDASIIIIDTKTGEEIIGMVSGETYDGTPATRVNTIVATSLGTEGAMAADSGRGIPEDETVVHGATGSLSEGGVEGIVVSGHEDQYIRFFDANSGMLHFLFHDSVLHRLIFYAGQCTYSMLAHPAAITSLAVSKDGREAVSAGRDASIRFWSLDKRICTQELTSHRIMRGEGVCSVVWSQDGRLVVSAGGDGVVNVLTR